MRANQNINCNSSARLQQPPPPSRQKHKQKQHRRHDRWHTHTVRRTPLPLSAVVRQANEQKKNWKDKNQSWCNRILYILGSHVVYHFRGGVCIATADAAAAIFTAKFMRYSDPLSIAQFLLHNSVFLSRAVFFFPFAAFTIIRLSFVLGFPCSSHSAQCTLLPDRVQPKV